MTKNKNSKPITRTYIKRTVGLSIALSFVQEMSCMNLQSQLTNLTNQLNQLTKTLTSSVSMTNKPNYESLLKTHEELKNHFDLWYPKFNALFESPNQDTYLQRSKDLFADGFGLNLAAEAYHKKLKEITQDFTNQLPLEIKNKLATFGLKTIYDLLNEKNNSNELKEKFEKIFQRDIFLQKIKTAEEFLELYKTMQMNEAKVLNVHNLTGNPTKNPTTPPKPTTTPTSHSTPARTNLSQAQKNALEPIYQEYTALTQSYKDLSDYINKKIEIIAKQDEQDREVKGFGLHKPNFDEHFEGTGLDSVKRLIQYKEEVLQHAQKTINALKAVVDKRADKKLTPQEIQYFYNTGVMGINRITDLLNPEKYLNEYPTTKNYIENMDRVERFKNLWPVTHKATELKALAQQENAYF